MPERRRFRVIPVRLNGPSGSEVLPTLVDAETWLPPAMALRWVVRSRRWECMPNTLAGNLRAIGLLYQWADAHLGQDLDAFVESGATLTGGQLDSLVAYLRTRVADDELARLKPGSSPSLATLGVVARPVRNLLKWAADPQTRGGRGIVDPLELSAYRTRLDLLFAPALAQNGPTERIRPLADGEDERLRELVSPLRAADGRLLLPFRFRSDNPFEPETRLRNWLMYQLARELGFRRSEILALWISDIESGSPAIVSVRRRPNDAADTRRDPASVKRGERALPPSDLLRAGLRAYQTTRWPVGRVGVNTPILLTSSVSRAPLAIRSASHVIETLGRAARIDDLCWHSLRHTWAEEVATDLLTDHNGDEERTLAVLCQLGVWSNTSPTPKHYIQNALRREAWRFQAHRAKRLWGLTHAIEAGA